VDPRLLKPLVGGALALGAYVFGKSLAHSKAHAQALQRSFERFHERIRHEQSGERGLLRERRETLQVVLASALDRQLRPRLFHQGSYALQTGVKPVSGEFDMDLGLVLECRRATFAGPIEAKQMVRDVLRQGSRRVRIRRSCVTVEYTNSNFGDFHVDLAVYVREPDGKLYLAKGKEHSEVKYVFWDLALPEELTRLLNTKWTGAQLAQFRRCVRYLKLWKQVNFDTKAPYSIALTVAAYHWFQPTADGIFSPVPNDIEALEALTGVMLQNFTHARLAVHLPVQPDVDLLKGMTAAQMRRFGEKLQELHDTLAHARASADIEQSLNGLRSQFGPEFG
jgi:hypothetical protein